MLAKFSQCFLLLAVGLIMLFSPFVGKAQSVKEECIVVTESHLELVLDLVYVGGTTGYEYRYVYKYVPRPVTKCFPVVTETKPTTSSNKVASNEQNDPKTACRQHYGSFLSYFNDKGVLTDGDKEKFDAAYKIVCPRSGCQWSHPNNLEDYSVIKNPSSVKSFDIHSSDIVGTWEYIKAPRTSTYIYSKDRIVESIHQLNGQVYQVQGIWKYIPKTATSGYLEEYLNGNLVERGNVNFLSFNQLEYTITFSTDSASIGKQYIWNRKYTFYK